MHVCFLLVCVCVCVCVHYVYCMFMHFIVKHFRLVAAVVIQRATSIHLFTYSPQRASSLYRDLDHLSLQRASPLYRDLDYLFLSSLQRASSLYRDLDPPVSLLPPESQVHHKEDRDSSGPGRFPRHAGQGERRDPSADQGVCLLQDSHQTCRQEEEGSCDTRSWANDSFLHRRSR